MHLFIRTMTVLISATIFWSCNRSENNTAGKGGNATLRIVPRHHNIATNLIDAKVFIKYDAQDIPNSYDDSASCVWINGTPTATLSGLKKGKYYLMGTAYDTSIKQSVKGGIPYEITIEATLNISLPVTEVH